MKPDGAHASCAILSANPLPVTFCELPGAIANVDSPYLLSHGGGDPCLPHVEPAPGRPQPAFTHPGTKLMH
jgi:hypothetical protein